MAEILLGSFDQYGELNESVDAYFSPIWIVEIKNEINFEISQFHEIDFTLDDMIGIEDDFFDIALLDCAPDEDKEPKSPEDILFEPIAIEKPEKTPG